MKNRLHVLLSLVLTIFLLLTAAACAQNTATEDSASATTAAPETTTAAPAPTVIEYVSKMTLQSDAAMYTFYVGYDPATRTMTLTSDNTSDNSIMFNLGLSFLLNTAQMKNQSNGIIPDNSGAPMIFNLLTHPLFTAGLVDHINLCAGNPYSRDANCQEYHFTRDESGKCTAYSFEAYSAGAQSANGTGTLTYDANGKLTQLLENDTISGEGTNTLVWNGDKLAQYNYAGGGLTMNTNYEYSAEGFLTKYSRTMTNGDQSFSYDEYFICDPATGFIAQANYPDSQATVDFIYDPANTHLIQAVMASEGNVIAAYEYANFTVPA